LRLDIVVGTSAFFRSLCSLTDPHDHGDGMLMGVAEADGPVVNAQSGR